MENKFKIKFDYNIPSWKLFLDCNINESYPELNIFMEVYENNLLIYSVKIFIKGHYYCCGSQNFEFDKISKTIIKDCDNNTIDNIYIELKNNYRHIFKNTVLDIWINRIFEELC